VIRPNVIIHELTRIGSNCTITFGKGIKEGSDIKDGEVVI
jgi:UDP-3-O-[3-hydroxymyristoyl] glucosamine N-acyltransferase